MSWLIAAVLGLPCTQGHVDAPGSRSWLDFTYYYVDPVRGVDQGNVSSPAQPWRTLTYALPRASEGPIVLAPGDYSEASGETFPLRPPRYRHVLGKVPHGARILGPQDGSVPVFDLARATLARVEIVAKGVAIAVNPIAGTDSAFISLNLSAEIRARRAVEVHLDPSLYEAYLGIYGSDIRAEEAAITVDGSLASPATLQLFLGSSVFRSGREGAVLDLIAGGSGRVHVRSETCAFHSSGAGLRLRPRDPLGLTVEVDSSVFHALGNAAFGGGPLIVEGAGPLAVAIRRSIFWNNHQTLDLPGYDPATYVLAENLVQEPGLIGVGGNITGDPRFAHAPSGDFHLRPDSPARGVGAVVPGPFPFDHEGDPRGHGPDDDRVDLGVDESYPRYHWFHPRPRLGKTTVCRIFGQPGDLAIGFASVVVDSPSEPSFEGIPPVGVGWQLGTLVSPQPFVLARIGPDGTAEVPFVFPRGLSPQRLTGRTIKTQIRYLTPQGGAEVSANAVLVVLTR